MNLFPDDILNISEEL